MQTSAKGCDDIRSFLSVVIALRGLSLKPSTVAAATFKNCMQLNKKYPNGVEKSAATAITQTNAPKVSTSDYRENMKVEFDAAH